MMQVINANAFKYIARREDGKEWLYELPSFDSIVDVELRGDSEITMSGVNWDGEVLQMARGKEIVFKAKLVGFRALSVECDGPFTSRATFTDGLEYRDPTPMVITEGRPVDPVKVAMAEEVRKQLEQWKLENLFRDPVQAQAEIDEFVDDLVDGDLEFEEDEFSVGAAAELEEERIALERQKAAQEAMEGDRLSSDDNLELAEQSEPKAPVGSRREPERPIAASASGPT